MSDISQTIGFAKRLGITITNADLDTQICAAWADRVVLAQSLFDRGDMHGCAAMIAEANAYAI